MKNKKGMGNKFVNKIYASDTSITHVFFSFVPKCKKKYFKKLTTSILIKKYFSFFQVSNFVEKEIK